MEAGVKSREVHIGEYCYIPLHFDNSRQKYKEVIKRNIKRNIKNSVS